MLFHERRDKTARYEDYRVQRSKGSLTTQLATGAGEQTDRANCDHKRQRWTRSGGATQLNDGQVASASMEVDVQREFISRLAGNQCLWTGTTRFPGQRIFDDPTLPS